MVFSWTLSEFTEEISDVRMHENFLDFSDFQVLLASIFDVQFTSTIFQFFNYQFSVFRANAVPRFSVPCWHSSFPSGGDDTAEDFVRAWRPMAVVLVWPDRAAASGTSACRD